MRTTDRLTTTRKTDPQNSMGEREAPVALHTTLVRPSTDKDKAKEVFKP